MKNIIVLIILITNLSIYAQGGIFQKKSKGIEQDDEKSELNQIPQRAYKIIVKNNLSSDENFILVARTLIENDWIIENKDKEFYTFKTGARELYKTRSGSYFLNFVVKDKSISLTGQCSPDIELSFGGVRSDKTYFKICYKGINGNIDKDAFIKMAEFSKKLGSDLEFVTED